jgi:hypothetical protein
VNVGHGTTQPDEQGGSSKDFRADGSLFDVVRRGLRYGLHWVRPTQGGERDKRAEQCRACAYKRRTLDEPVRAARLRAQRRWWRDNRARVPVRVAP